MEKKLYFLFNYVTEGFNKVLLFVVVVVFNGLVQQVAIANLREPIINQSERTIILII